MIIFVFVFAVLGRSLAKVGPRTILKTGQARKMVKNAPQISPGYKPKTKMHCLADSKYVIIYKVPGWKSTIEAETRASEAHFVESGGPGAGSQAQAETKTSR